jgi:hypothetical protein
VNPGNKSQKREPVRVRLTPINGIDGPAIFSHKSPSEEFLNAISTAEDLDSATCFFCGRVHFSSEATQPKRILSNHLLHTTTSLKVGLLEKRIFVFDCPCNAAFIYEQLFWKHLKVFAKYSIARTNKQLQKAQEKLSLAKSIATEP